MGEKRLFAIRGATRCLNDNIDISKQVVELYDELLSKNKLNEEDVVSAIFSVTGDIDAKNPATALREEGRAGNIALFAVQEANFPGSLDRVIRLLIHCYLESPPVHIYRNGAEALRLDYFSSK
jgi:chorismate mutase